MTNRGNARPVYSTEAGRICPRCGWPEQNCQCSRKTEDPIPSRIVAKLRMEKKGRGGKTEILTELQEKTAIPGVLPTFLQPIQTRIVMLSTGFRAMPRS